MATIKTVTPPKAPAAPKVDPYTLTGAAERQYRRDNPYSDYAKQKEMRYINDISQNVKNNTGVASPQMAEYNKLLQKWNVADPNAPKPFDQQAFMDQMTGQINSMFDAQKQSQLAQLQASRDKAVGDINQQIANTAPEYAQKRNQADVVNAQNVQRLRELMAQNGLSASGENVTAQTAQNNQRLNSLNSLNLQEQQQLNDYQKRIADLNNPANEQALSASLDAERNKALLDAYNKSIDTGLQQQQNTFNNGLAVAGLTGTYNGSPTLALQQLTQQQQQALKDAEWNKYIYNNLSADQKAQLGLNKYQIDTGNQAQIGQNQALLDYYKSLGFNSSSEGSGAIPQSFQQDMATAIQKGVPAEWAPVLSEIVKRESSYNPNAKNPTSTAYGYGQFLDSTRKTYEKKTGLNYSDPVNQLIMMAQYVKDRYGTPQKALQFWKDNQWY